MSIIKRKCEECEVMVEVDGEEQDGEEHYFLCQDCFLKSEVEILSEKTHFKTVANHFGANVNSMHGMKMRYEKGENNRLWIVYLKAYLYDISGAKADLNISHIIVSKHYNRKNHHNMKRVKTKGSKKWEIFVKARLWDLQQKAH